LLRREHEGLVVMPLETLYDLGVSRNRRIEDLRRVEIPVVRVVELRQPCRAVRHEDGSVVVEIELPEKIARNRAEHVRAAEDPFHRGWARAVEETVIVAGPLQEIE